LKKPFFLTGLGLLCLSVLVQQICLTRILSVMTFFHLAFVSISMAMLGLTAGAVLVYLKGYDAKDLPTQLPRLTRYYAISSAVGLFVLCSTYMPASMGVNNIAAITKIVALMAIPYTFAGMAIALCLTRSEEYGSIGLRYAVDLCSAAAGCLLCIPLLNYVSAPYAVLIAALTSYLASLLFSAATQNTTAPFKESAAILLGFVAMIGILTSQQDRPNALYAPTFKAEGVSLDKFAFNRWNSFSNIMISEPAMQRPFYWGASQNAPRTVQSQSSLLIDGMAGTPLYKFEGDYSKLGFLKHDITNLAYFIRHQGASAVIGVGGGRDVMAARHFGFNDVTAVELNPIIVNMLNKDEPFASFVNLRNDPHIKMHVDDGRSWFARTDRKFDLIQMSMIDTFAATGAGGFTLSENGLYTVEGWQHFLNALTENGAFTVSRWYSPHNVNETGRVVSLAMAALWRNGVTDIRKHIYLAGRHQLSTLIITKQPLTTEEIATLDRVSDDMGYTVLVHPTKDVEAGLISEMIRFTDEASLDEFARQQLLDVSAPTDSRPFFFNQLRLSQIANANKILAQEGYEGGTVVGNLRATISLLLIIAISFFAIIFVLLVPTFNAVKGLDRSYARAGTTYFMLIGLGFMLVEIALIQRTSLFLGHPTHGLAIALFSLILATGLGSLASSRINLMKSYSRLRLLPLLTFAVLLLSAWLAPGLFAQHEGASLAVRGAIAVATIALPAFFMGFAFPVGMTLAESINATPTPWFWSVNGAAGVLASGLAVLISMTFSIPVTLLCGAVCYLLLLKPMSTMYGLRNRA